MRSRRDSRILVVDNHLSERRQIVTWLRRTGFAAVEAANAVQAALHLYRQPHQIDLVIIDVVGTSCLDLAAEIERDDRGIPILYLSGYVDSLVVQAIGWRSPELLLLKPFTGKLLVDRVRRLLRNAPDIAPAEPTPAGDLCGEAEHELR